MDPKLDKVVKPGQVAKTLSIAYTDLPDLGRLWTKRDVRELQQAKPDWLTAARRRHAAATEARTAARAQHLAATLDRLGYDAPDEGTTEQAIAYIDPARTHLMIATDCSEEEADRAAWLLWPDSMGAEAAEEHEPE